MTSSRATCAYGRAARARLPSRGRPASPPTRRGGSGSIPICGRSPIRTCSRWATPPTRWRRPGRPIGCRPMRPWYRRLYGRRNFGREQRPGRKERRASAALSFAAYGQGVAIGRVGVGFTTFPDDTAARFLVTGRTGLRVRNFFVRFLVTLIKMERKYPGLFFTLGRRRVSWQRARNAMQARAA